MTWTNGAPLKGMNTKHFELIELMVLEPELNNRDLAVRLSLTEPWISHVKHTDLFQEEYRKRLSEHRSKVSDGIVQKTAAVADLALTRIRNTLQDEAADIPLGRLESLFATTAKHLFPSERGASTVVNIALADPDAIRKARERAERLRTNVVDVTPELIGAT